MALPEIELDGFDRTDWAARDPMDPDADIFFPALIEEVRAEWPCDLNSWLIQVRIKQVPLTEQHPTGTKTEPVWDVTFYFAVNLISVGFIMRPKKIAKSIEEGGYAPAGQYIANMVRQKFESMATALKWYQ